MEYKTKKNRINIQQIMLIVLFVLVGILTTTLITLAIYSGTATDRYPITFAPGVGIELTGNKGIDKPRLPGDIVPIELGFKLTNKDNTESSPAYVRVKFESFIKQLDENEDLENLNELDKLIDFESSIFTNKENNLTWVPVNFAQDGEPDDLWYLYVRYIDETDFIESKIVESGEVGTFLKGNVSFSGKIERNFANRELVIEFTAEASQSENILDPILSQEKDESGVYRGIWQDPKNK